MQIIKFYLFFILGIFLTVFIYQAYTIYQLRAVAVDNRQIILSDRAVLGNVIEFLKAKYPELQGQKPADNTAPAAPATATSSAKANTTASSTKK